MAGYCTADDVYAYGIPRGAIPNSGRLAAGASASTDAIELDQHGLSTDTPFQLRAEAGGSLPAPLAAGTTYYAIVDDDSHFGAAATAGGARIDLTTVGARTLVITAFPMTEAIEWASRVIDDMIPAACVPLDSPYPPIVVVTAAELAAGKLAARAGTASTSLSALVDAAQKRLARWAQNLPIRGDNAPTPAALSSDTSALDAPTDARGWGTYGAL